MSKNGILILGGVIAFLVFLFWGESPQQGMVSTTQPTKQTASHQEIVSLKDFAPGESFRKAVRADGRLSYDVLEGCLEVEGVSAKYPRTLETLCAGGPKGVETPVAYLVFTARNGPAVLRIQE